ncbi:MAG: methyltransferase domain-containing protein, partial [Vicinamibacterales bacterium]
AARGWRRYDRVVQRRDAIEMLAGGVSSSHPAVWADLGCGDGTFTMALASLLPPGSTIHAIDRDAAALRQIPADHQGVAIVTRVADIAVAPAGLDRLDGVLMANSLHYVREQAACVRSWSALLSPAGRWLIVEYDTDAANQWVPYPISRQRLPTIVAGSRIRDLGRRPSLYRPAALYAAVIEPGAPAD